MGHQLALLQLGAERWCSSSVPLVFQLHCPAESPARENVTLLLFSCSAVLMQVTNESCAVKAEME